MKPEIALIYDADCPNVPEVRAALREALERMGLEPRWTESDQAGVDRPLRFGSPTILVDGVDVAGDRGEAAAACCRVYQAARGFRGVPPVEVIAAAITRKSETVSGEKEES